VFTARYGLSRSIIQIRFVFQWLKYVGRSHNSTTRKKLHIMTLYPAKANMSALLVYTDGFIFWWCLKEFVCVCCCIINSPENIRVHRRNFADKIDGMQSGKQNIWTSLWTETSKWSIPKSCTCSWYWRIKFADVTKKLAKRNWQNICGEYCCKFIVTEGRSENWEQNSGVKNSLNESVKRRDSVGLGGRQK
jgi:hypothetical protein